MKLQVFRSLPTEFIAAIIKVREKTSSTQTQNEVVAMVLAQFNSLEIYERVRDQGKDFSIDIAATLVNNTIHNEN
jgi:hypothetical protein